jgi:DNA-binding MarR family transcriptional regulator
MSATSVPPPKVSDAVNVLLRALNVKGNEVARSAGLTQPQAMLLRALHREGRVSASELAAEVGFSPPALTSSLDFLAKRRLVRRYRDEGDRRRVWIEITSTGRTLSKGYLRRFHALHKQVNALFPAERAPALSESLLIIAREMGAREDWIEQRCPLCHPSGAGGVGP